MLMKYYSDSTMWKFLKVDFLNYTPCLDNVVSFSVKLNGVVKAVLGIFFISNKTISRYSREYIEKVELSHSVF